MFLSHDLVTEVVVVIDGSQDGSLEYVAALSEEEARVRYTDNGQNRGLPYSRNKGIGLAQHEYVFTGEDDLELTEGFFETLLSHMSQTGADVISGRNIFRYETETAADAIRRTDKIKGASVNKRQVTVQTGAPVRSDQEQLLLPAPMLGFTEVFQKVKFDEEYRVNFWREESDFQLAAQEQGYKLVYCPHAISFNFMIENDRSGSHAAVGFSRAVWTVRNNLRFIKKHRIFIDREFELGNLQLYITKFAIRRVSMEVLMPFLGRVKREILNVFSSLTGSRRRA
jgi:GT2 family glycosyltransferase